MELLLPARINEAVVLLRALRELYQFLGIEPPEDYLDDCAAIVYESPNKSRHGADWNEELIDLVNKEIARFSFLHGYSYDN